MPAVGLDGAVLIGGSLDHPEGLCVGPDGDIHAGGEAGQLYRIAPDGTVTEVADTGGFLLGLALDGAGTVHGCDYRRNAILAIDRDGQVRTRCDRIDGAALRNPNWPVFLPDGTLLFSESGDYGPPPGIGRVLRLHPDDRVEVCHPGPFAFANGMALDPTGAWLYVVESCRPGVVRIPVDGRGAVEPVVALPPDTVPDGIAVAADGRLAIACYAPDIVYLATPGGALSVIAHDPSGETLNRPTNVAIAAGRLIVANLGGYHLTVLPSDLPPLALPRPLLG